MSKRVNHTVLIGMEQTDNVSFGGATYRIDTDKPEQPAITDRSVRLALTDRGGKVIGDFEEFELI